MILLIKGCSVKYLPRPEASADGNTLITPGGNPASSAKNAKAVADNGVSEAGLITAVQPVAIAAPNLRVIIANGNSKESKYHKPNWLFKGQDSISPISRGIISP